MFNILQHIEVELNLFFPPDFNLSERPFEWLGRTILAQQILKMFQCAFSLVSCIYMSTHIQCRAEFCGHFTAGSMFLDVVSSVDRKHGFPSGWAGFEEMLGKLGLSISVNLVHVVA